MNGAMPPNLVDSSSFAGYLGSEKLSYRLIFTLYERYKGTTRIMEFEGISFGLSTHTLIFGLKITLKLPLYYP